ncbi:MAG: hypothetical protein O2912_00675 [Proteobacteria bacterium]|nr:hypothetical protein [Pseudomonadota bacterium]
MTTAISAPSNSVLQPKPILTRPVVAADTEPEEIDHPFADIEGQYAGETILKSDLDKFWNEDQSKDLFGKDGFSFDDFLDIINPLQHIPIVSSIYRSVTGDGIEPGARIAGGALFGGGIGFVGAMINALIEDGTGKDVGDHALAMLGVENGGSSADPEQLAAIETAAGKAAQNAMTPGGGSVKTALLEDGLTQNSPGITQVKPSMGVTKEPGNAPFVPVKSRKGQAFGGIMIPPNGMPTVANSKPTGASDALIQARSAVPSRGGRSANGASRTNRITQGAGPKASRDSLAQPLVNPKDPIAISPTMAAKLSKISKQSAAANQGDNRYAVNRAAAAPSGTQRPSAGPTAGIPTPPKPMLPAGNFRNAASNLPVPNVMVEALDKYEAMVRERRRTNS